MKPYKNDPEKLRRLKDIKLFMSDLDGTVYLGSEPLPGAIDAVRTMRECGRVCFLTNNSSKSKNDYYDKLSNLGFSPDKSEIYTSGMSAIRYLQRIGVTDRVYVLGTDKLLSEFYNAGIGLTEESPRYVVVGFDTSLTYDKLVKVTDFIRAGIPYLATHPDVNCPVPGGYIPDAGSFIELIRASTNRLPDIITGKPYIPMFEAVSERFNVRAADTAMIGDRMETDIKLAVNNGILGILVLSGATDISQLAGFEYKPDLIFESVKELAEELKNCK